MPPWPNGLKSRAQDEDALEEAQRPRTMLNTASHRPIAGVDGGRMWIWEVIPVIFSYFLKIIWKIFFVLQSCCKIDLYMLYLLYRKATISFWWLSHHKGVICFFWYPSHLIPPRKKRQSPAGYHPELLSSLVFTLRKRHVDRSSPMDNPKCWCALIWVLFR